MENFVGYWNLEDSEDFDNYMKKIGIGTVGNNTKLSVEILKDNDEYFLLKTYSSSENMVLKFELNKEQVETTIDGGSVKTTFTLEGNKLVQTKKSTNPDDKVYIIVREVRGDRLRTRESNDDRSQRLKLEHAVEEAQRVVQRAQMKIKLANETFDNYKSMKKFFGFWFCQSSSDNLHQFLLKLGVSKRFKKNTDWLKASFEIFIKEEKYVLKTSSTLSKIPKLKFELNKELDETTVDGRSFKTTFTLVGNKLVQTMKSTKADDKDYIITREVEGDTLITKLECDGVEAVCTFARGQKP